MNIQALTLGELAELTDTAAGRLTQTYRQPLDATTQPPTLAQTPRGDDWLEQLFTLLQSLGYLSSAPPPTTEEIEAQFARWRADCAAIPAGDLAWKIGRDEALDSLEPSELARRQLKAAATPEGEVELKRAPAVGESSVLARIAAYRIGLFSDHPVQVGEETFTAVRAAQLAQLAGLLNRDPNTTLELLGSIEALNECLRERYHRIVFALPIPQRPEGGPGPDRLRFKIKATRLTQNGRIEVPIPWTESISAGRLEEGSGSLADEATRKFVINFLQVRLWMLGYYQGAIDRDWDKMSSDALDGFLHDYAPEVNLDGVLKPADAAGWRALDLGFLLSRFHDAVDRPLHEVEQGDLETQLDRLFHHREVIALPDGDPLWTQLDAAAQVSPDEPRLVRQDERILLMADDAPEGPTKRRRYFGWRGIFSSIGNLLKKIVEAGKEVVAKLIEWFKKSVAAVRQIGRYLVEHTRLAVRVGRLALERLRCWLAGTPIISAENGVGCATLWQRDFDTVFLVSSGCPAELQARHAQTIEWMNASFAFFLAVGLEVVKLIESVGIAWWLFAWRVLQAIRNVVQDWREFAERAGMAGFFTATTVA